MPNTVETLDEGIKVTLNESPYWILFTKEWDNLAPRRFRKLKDDLMALRMVVEKAIGWNMVDGNWNPLPFDKPKLLAEIDAFVAETSDECFSVPVQLVAPLIEAFYSAYGAALNLPFENKSQCT